MPVSTPHGNERAKVPPVSDNRAARLQAHSSENSHAIRVSEVSIKSENVAIPTISFQDLKGAWGNCMRNWGAQQRCARGPRQGPRAAAEANRQHTNDKPRPIGGRREACGAWPGFEPTRRAKLAARTASGRAGRAAAGDLSGQQAPHACDVGITKPPGPNGARRQWGHSNA